MRAGVALGANLGERFRNLISAREQIFALPEVTPPLLSSSMYETAAIGCEPGAGKFLNAVIEIGYEGAAEQLLAQLQQIEARLGRPADHARDRSRPIDLDLLYFGSFQRDDEQLRLPHPRMHLRDFVLHPLADIRPELILPGQTKTVAELLAQLPSDGSVVRTARQW
jgi:2-amino-4-hydroxy-6-hydroxymethyldihydropteridine diphosphokinase